MSDILSQFREDPLPPSGVDLARAVRTGRRQRRTRTGVAAAGLVAVVALGAATAPQWLAYVPGRTPVSPSSPLACDGAGPLPPYQAADPATPTDFDLLRQWADLRGVSGYELVSYTTSRYWQVVELTTPTLDRTVTITVYALDGDPTYRTSDAAPPEPLDPAAGRPADAIGATKTYQLPAQQFAGEQSAGLAWEWTPGAWAFVAATNAPPPNSAVTTASNVDTNALRATANQVATELRIAPAAPVTSPVLVKVPACTRPVWTSLMHGTKADGTPFSRFGLGFGGRDYVDSSNPLLSAGGSAPVVTVTADSGATPADKPGSATLEVDGHPAASISSLLVVYGVDGFALEVTTLEGYDAAVAIFRSTHVYSVAAEGEVFWAEPLFS